MGLPIWPFGKDIKTVSDMIQARKDRAGTGEESWRELYVMKDGSFVEPEFMKDVSKRRLVYINNEKLLKVYQTYPYDGPLPDFYDPDTMTYVRKAPVDDRKIGFDRFKCPYCGGTDIVEPGYGPDRCTNCKAASVDGDWYWDKEEDQTAWEKRQRDWKKKRRKDLKLNMDSLGSGKGMRYATGGLVVTSSTEYQPEIKINNEINFSSYTKKELTDMQEAFRKMGDAGVKGAKAGVALKKAMDKVMNEVSVADNDGEIVERETIIHYSNQSGLRVKDMEVDLNTGKVVWESEARIKAREEVEEKANEPKTRAIDI